MLTCGGTGFGPRDAHARSHPPRHGPGGAGYLQIRARGRHALAAATGPSPESPSGARILNLSGRPAGGLEQLQLAWPLLAVHGRACARTRTPVRAIRMKVWVRIDHVGWVHIWRSQADYNAAEPSAHFVNGRTDPRWQEVSLSAEARAALGLRRPRSRLKILAISQPRTADRTGLPRAVKDEQRAAEPETEKRQQVENPERRMPEALGPGQRARPAAAGPWPNWQPPRPWPPASRPALHDPRPVAGHGCWLQRREAAGCRPAAAVEGVPGQTGS